ncbi:MAG: hypothetical protein RLZZ557_2246, partial [Bacteroidota bacterium]
AALAGDQVHQDQTGKIITTNVLNIQG